MYQLRPFEQYIYCKNKQLDGMNNIYDNSNVFSITLKSNEAMLAMKAMLAMLFCTQTIFPIDNENPSSEKKFCVQKSMEWKQYLYRF